MYLLYIFYKFIILTGFNFTDLLQTDHIIIIVTP
jgi:hypothetical protein